MGTLPASASKKWPRRQRVALVGSKCRPVTGMLVGKYEMIPLLWLFSNPEANNFTFACHA